MSQPVLKDHQIIKALKYYGFFIVRQRGSHVRLRYEDGRVVSVPFHSGLPIKCLSPCGYCHLVLVVLFSEGFVCQQ